MADCIEPGSVIHTDGWLGYAGLEKKGYQGEITKIAKRREEASPLMPRVHRVVSLLKHWLLGTHQGGVAHYYLPCYLDEFSLFASTDGNPRADASSSSGSCNKLSTPTENLRIDGQIRM